MLPAAGAEGVEGAGAALAGGWQRARDVGLLRYAPPAPAPARWLRGAGGRYRYLLQLNPSRAGKRRAPEFINNIKQSFDTSQFNFTKVSPEEVILKLSDDNIEEGSGVHAVLVNVSPISELHSLLCPFIQSCLPQIITPDSLKLAMRVMFLLGDPGIRIGFNSLCAMASVNHLHYHILVENAKLPVEYVKCIPLAGPLYCFAEDYPGRGFCFELKSALAIEETCSDVYKLIEYLLENNVAHNVLLTRGESVDGTGSVEVTESVNATGIVNGPGSVDGTEIANEPETVDVTRVVSGAGSVDGIKREVVRCVVWPRHSSHGAKQLDAFNVAVCELSGWIPVYNKEAYDSLRTSDIEEELRKWTLEPFHNVLQDVTQLYSEKI